jgi:hypothetical protein
MQEKIFITNSHGLKLAAILHKPEDFKIGQKYPTVIVLHGFTGYKEEPNIETLANDLENNGFVAICFDASGFGESDGTLSADYRFSNYLQDTECIYEYLKNLPFVDKNRIGIAGHSWGVKMCVIFGAKHPQIKAIVPIAAVEKLTRSNWLSAFMQVWRDTGWYKLVSSKYGSLNMPFVVVQDDEKWDTWEEVKKIHSAIFIIIGKNDDTVAPVDTRKIFENANEPKKLWEVEGVGHDYKKYPEQIQMINREVVKFFKENLMKKETVFEKIKKLFQSIKNHFLH